MSEWRECELKEVAEVQTGPFGSQLKNEQYITGGTPVITVEHINNFRIDDFDYPSVTDEDKNRLAKYLLKSGDIIFTRVGSVDLSAFVQPHQNGWMFSSRMLRVRVKQDVDSRFLSYFFQQKQFREYILNISVGATMPSINTEILKGIPISYPPLPEQKAIAEVLSALDDKIDLLHRQNKTLEQMAETLFRQWFVVEAGEDWGYVELGNFVNITNGVSYKSSDLNEGDTALVTLKSFARNGGFRQDGFKEYTGKFKESHIVNIGDIAVAHTDITQDAALIGNPIFIENPNNYKKLLISMDLAKVNLTSNRISKIFVYFLMRTRFFKSYCVGYSNGSTVLHLNKQAIPLFEFFLPPKELIDTFSIKAENLIRKQNKNKQQIRTLESLRDTLLPKLMSGEIRVDYDMEAE